MTKPHMRLYAGQWVTAERAERMALIDSLRVGDLIRYRGNLRVVRDVWHPPTKSPRPRSTVQGIVVAIRRCSWTRRPTTTINRFDMYLGQLEVVRRGYGTDRTDLSKSLQDEIEAFRGTCKVGMRCRDVARLIA